ncbi:MAG: tRNA lysidine(34) synthetase TilS [Clostridia bacterium]|nr:tRNA lysidine(34) synthetase TilS [Clostridia bacterium]
MELGADRLLPLLREAARSGGLPPGARLVVAVSGGRDSVALLHALRSLAPEYGWSLAVAHFDHGFRPESGDDARWVRDLAGALGLPFILGRGAGGRLSEAPARRARHRFLRRARGRLGADRVVLAHHARDQVETMLMNLVRGAGLRGAAGMPARRGPLVRPWLLADPREIAAYAESQGLAYRSDPTNEDERLLRNRLRRRVVAELATLAPGALVRMAAAGLRMREDDRLLRRLAREALGKAERPRAPGELLRVSALAVAGLDEALRLRALAAAYARAARRASRARRRLRLAPARLDGATLARLERLVRGEAGRALALPRAIEAQRLGPHVAFVARRPGRSSVLH